MYGMNHKGKEEKKKLFKASEKVHRRIKMRATDTGKTIEEVLDEATSRWSKYDIKKD